MASAVTSLQSVEDLFRFLFEHEQTVVFTNLGRKPAVVFEILNRDYSNVDVAVVSPYYQFPSRDRIHTFKPEQIASVRCDLLLFIEPPPHVGIVKPPHASRLVVLTSHMVFPRPQNSLLVSYFYGPRGLTVDQLITATRSLASVRDVSIQTVDANRVSVDHTDARVFTSEEGRGGDDELSTGYAILDLTRYTSKVTTYLKFWDLFDRLLELRYRQSESKTSDDAAVILRGWVACFNEVSKGYRAFLQFTQNVLDALCCVRQFEHGNVLELTRVLALLPFFQSGIVERPLELTKESFGGIEYVVPKTELELFHASTKLNLSHFVGSVYRVMDDEDNDVMRFR